MERLPCHVVYVNRAAGHDRLLQAVPDGGATPPSSDWKLDHTRQLVQPLLDAFGNVHVCASGPSCLSKLIQLQDNSRLDTTPTLLLLDTPHDQQFLPALQPSSPTHLGLPSPPGHMDIYTPDEELYGLTLLQKLVTEAHLRNVSKLVVPVPVISLPRSDDDAARDRMTDGAVEAGFAAPGILDAYRPLIRKCLDIGAVDVLISPLSPKCIATLEICAYRARRDAAHENSAIMEITKGRKRSWVGVNEQKPYAYLREEMVAGLMKRICRLDHDESHITGAHIAVPPQRQTAVAAAVGRWHFSAHDFSDDELLVGAVFMFKHTLSMPELEQWRIATGQLISYLVACRAAYNTFVPYHNFRHVIDVLQATFSFLVQIAALPPYPQPAQPQADATPPQSPMAGLVTAFEALTLLITAVGHDVGHPGVNNGFLTTLNAPLAQLYNDRSVLESFHCAAYSQILRRYWPAVFEDRKMRNLIISSVLATDMGLHFDYMKKLGALQEKLQHESDINGWNGRQVEEHRVLMCSLLIKCADISNVARHHDAALQWMHILSEEFSRQSSMEEELQIKSSLMAPPKKDMMSLANAQLGFMNMFAIPLFQGVVDLLPAMQYTVDELEANKGLFEKKIEEEKAKESRHPRGRLRRDRTCSPGTKLDSPEATSDDETSQTRQPESGSNATTGRQGWAADPQVLAEVKCRDSQPLPGTSERPSNSQSTEDYQEVSGQLPQSGPVKELADGAAFGFQSRGGSSTDSKTSTPSGRQRGSETTDGSTSGPYAADWRSQAASATTGKSALSPSTQGTSIVSNESLDRTLSASGPNSSPPSTSNHGSPTTAFAPEGEREEIPPPAGNVVRDEGKTLKKRPSRFRMKDFPFFRRNKGSSPPLPAADASN